MVRVERLTSRELQCLFYVTQDKTVNEIAVEMCIGPEGVKKHRKMILQKLHCTTIAGAVVVAVKHKLLQV